MTVIYVVLCVILYFFIGGVIAGIIHDEELDAAAIIAWPIMIFFFLAVLVFSALKAVGYTIADIFSYFIRGGDNE